MWKEAHIGAVLKTATSSPPWTHSFTLLCSSADSYSVSAILSSPGSSASPVDCVPNIPSSFLLLSVLQLVFASTFALLQLVFIITSEVLLNTSCSYGLVQVRLAQPLWPGPLLPLSLCLPLLLRTASFSACAAVLLLLSMPRNSLSSKSAPLSTFSQMVNCHPTATHTVFQQHPVPHSTSHSRCCYSPHWSHRSKDLALCPASHTLSSTCYQVDSLTCSNERANGWVNEWMAGIEAVVIFTRVGSGRVLGSV